MVLEVRDMSVRYGYGRDAVPAVSDVDLDLHRGEVLGLTGESGSGKSTLAYAITRLLRPPGVVAAGDVIFRPAGDGGPGRDIHLLQVSDEELRQLRWAELAMVFQSAMHALNPVISVGAQLTDVLRAHRRGTRKEMARDRAGEMLELVGIDRSRLTSYPHELSGGMRQRVMIAMALALEPQVVIMDEPTTALDVVTQREIIEQIVDLKARLGFAVVFITHDLSLLAELAGRICVMYAGRIVEQGPALSVFRAPRHPYAAGLVGSFPSLRGERRRLEGIPGSPPDLRELGPGCAFADRCPNTMDRCRSQRPLLMRPGVDVDRQVACWLHDGRQPVPSAVDRPEPRRAAVVSDGQEAGL